jgi:hypothetical protein
MGAIVGMDLPRPRRRPWSPMDLGRSMYSMDLGRPMVSMENGNLPGVWIPWETAIYRRHAFHGKRQSTGGMESINPGSAKESINPGRARVRPGRAGLRSGHASVRLEPYPTPATITPQGPEPHSSHGHNSGQPTPPTDGTLEPQSAL